MIITILILLVLLWVWMYKSNNIIAVVKRVIKRCIKEAEKQEEIHNIFRNNAVLAEKSNKKRLIERILAERTMYIKANYGKPNIIYIPRSWEVYMIRNALIIDENMICGMKIKYTDTEDENDIYVSSEGGEKEEKDK